MMKNSTASSGVPTLKWLVVPRQAWVAMMVISSTMVSAVIQPMILRIRGHSGRSVKIHASVTV